MTFAEMIDQAIAQATMNPTTDENKAEEEVANAIAAESEPVATPAVTEPTASFAQMNGIPEGAAPQTEVTGVVEIPPEMAYHHKGMRHKLVFEGVCTHCAHCGQPLSDAVSAERGIGPICSKKGYHETPMEEVDATDALIALAEYPVLVDYLTKKYKPAGNRALCNGLVRTASLNRRTPVHAACCDAVEALGYKRLASALRESIAVIEIYEVAERPDSLMVWVKKCDFKWAFWGTLKHQPGVFMVKHPKPAIVVPKKMKSGLARLIVEHYEGLAVKTKNGTHKISKKWFEGKSNQQEVPASDPAVA